VGGCMGCCVGWLVGGWLCGQVGAWASVRGRECVCVCMCEKERVYAKEPYFLSEEPYIPPKEH